MRGKALFAVVLVIVLAPTTAYAINEHTDTLHHAPFNTVDTATYNGARQIVASGNTSVWSYRVQNRDADVVIFHLRCGTTPVTGELRMLSSGEVVRTASSEAPLFRCSNQAVNAFTNASRTMTLDIQWTAYTAGPGGDCQWEFGGWVELDPENGACDAALPGEGDEVDLTGTNERLDESNDLLELGFGLVVFATSLTAFRTYRRRKAEV